MACMCYHDFHFSDHPRILKHSQTPEVGLALALPLLENEPQLTHTYDGISEVIHDLKVCKL